ncbi:MAG: tetratricopeptide repeat protein, partial [Planctomycetota bacterium]|nr:tetratricopeptide repeat protein [Planctomycetota bacterium]
MNEWFQAEFHAERAHQFYESGQWDKALAELRLALAFDPDQSDWHFGMGLALEALHRFDEAAASYEQVLRLRGDDVETMLHMGLALMHGSHATRAIDMFSRASTIDPECEPALCHRIAAYT